MIINSSFGVHRPLILLFVFFLGNGSVHAITLEQISELTSLTKITAEAICKPVPIEGSSTKIEISGEAGIALNSLLKKIVDAKIEGAGNYLTEEYKGVLRSDLAKAISDENKCKSNVFNRLLALFEKNQSQQDVPLLEPYFKYGFLYFRKIGGEIHNLQTFGSSSQSILFGFECGYDHVRWSQRIKTGIGYSPDNEDEILFTDHSGLHTTTYNMRRKLAETFEVDSACISVSISHVYKITYQDKYGKQYERYYSLTGSAAHKPNESDLRKISEQIYEASTQNFTEHPIYFRSTNIIKQLIHLKR